MGRSTPSASSGCSSRRARAKRSRCGAANRSPMSRRSRSPAPRSGAWRSCGCARPNSPSTPTSRPAATPKCSARSRRCSRRSRCASGCTAQRMLALYRSGRQGDALEAYREARQALVTQIGVEPGPELRRLQDAILRQDASLEPPGLERAELPPELDTRTPLDGRDRELDWLRGHWRRVQAGAGGLVLITGAAGIGKWVPCGSADRSGPWVSPNDPTLKRQSGRAARASRWPLANRSASGDHDWSWPAHRAPGGHLPRVFHEAPPERGLLYLPSADAGGLLPWRQHDLIGAGQGGQAVTRIVRIRGVEHAPQVRGALVAGGDGRRDRP